MAYDRRSFAGGAIATTLSAGIDASTLTVPISASTGWPTGSGGDFGIIIDRGTASEEKLLGESRSGLNVTIASGGRGIDGTSGVTHTIGATVEVCILARDLDEANAHIAETSLDHHTQYLNEARHDLEARHQFGAALGTPSAAADIGTAAATGSGDDPAREDHVHKIGTGAINSAGMFAAGVVDAAAIATDAVGSAELANNAVDTAAIADDAVTNAKIADGAIDAAAKFAAGVVDSAAIAANAVGSSELADNAVDTAAIADGAVTVDKLADGIQIVCDVHSDTINGNSDGTTVAFGDTFAAAPVVQLTVEVGSNFDLLPNLVSVSTTGFVYRVAQKDSDSVSGSYDLHWTAIGTLA